MTAIIQRPDVLVELPAHRAPWQLTRYPIDGEAETARCARLTAATAGHNDLVVTTAPTSEARIRDPWGERTPYGAGERWPERVDVHLADGWSEGDVEWVPTAAVLHSNGDGLELAVADGRLVGIRGRADDRVNHGRVDPKDLYGWQANGSPDRLRRPLMRDGDRLVETDWDTAMNRIVERSRALLAQPGGWGRIGFHTSGQLFLEEYYTLGVIGKAGIGTPHMDGNTRLCTATAAAALKASFGTDGQPGSYTSRCGTARTSR